MRVSENPKELSALYCGDNGHDGIIVCCEVCEEDFVDRTHHGEPCFCPKCGKELVYRPWNSW